MYTNLPIPVKFIDPFSPYEPGSLPTIWISRFRKRNGDYVEIDWSAKALLRSFPASRRNAILNHLYFGRNNVHTEEGEVRAFRAKRSRTSHVPFMTYSVAKSRGTKPIRKLRGVIRGNRKIPSWALDAEITPVVNAFKDLRYLRMNSHPLLTMPDASRARLVEIIKEIQHTYIHEYAIDQGSYDPSTYTLVFNPELAAEKDALLSIKTTNPGGIMSFLDEI